MRGKELFEFQTEVEDKKHFELLHVAPGSDLAACLGWELEPSHGYWVRRTGFTFAFEVLPNIFSI